MIQSYEAALDGFLNYLKIIKKSSEHTIRNYSIDLKLFYTQIRKEEKEIVEKNCCYDLNLIDRKKIRSFLAWMQIENMSRKTIARRLSSLRSFFFYCYKQNIIQNNPVEAIESLKIEKRVPRSITYDQIVHFFNMADISTALGIRDRAIMELFYSSGLRISELAHLNREDIDITNLLMLVKGKGRKERLVPITANAAEWIHRYLQSNVSYSEEKALFINRFGTRISTRSIDRMFVKYLLKSGLYEHITPHTIRHTIATHWLENGMNLKTIQLLLGHDSMATTTIYTQVSIQLKKEIIKKFHPRSAM